MTYINVLLLGLWATRLQIEAEIVEISQIMVAMMHNCSHHGGLIAKMVNQVQTPIETLNVYDLVVTSLTHGDFRKCHHH